MSRNYDQFPDDDNGDALWAMREQGDCLSKPREIDFSIIFTEEKDALKFGEMLLINRQKISLCDDEEDADYPLEITLHAYMLPTHANIGRYEELLEDQVGNFNGHYDGWGCFSSEREEEA